MSELNSSPALKRSFGMREAVTITAGSVIGVGLFTVGSNIVGLMGPSVIFATIVALLISVYPALLYAEMGAALPYAGGTYQFASVGIGRAAGVLAGWNFIISLVAVTGGEALAFSYYFKTLFSAFGVTLPFSDVAIAVVITAGFIVANVCGVKIAGRLQNGFMFFLVSHHDPQYQSPLFRTGTVVFAQRRTNEFCGKRLHDLVVLRGL